MYITCAKKIQLILDILPIDHSLNDRHLLKRQRVDNLGASWNLLKLLGLLAFSVNDHIISQNFCTMHTT